MPAGIRLRSAAAHACAAGGSGAQRRFAKPRHRPARATGLAHPLAQLPRQASGPGGAGYVRPAAFGTLQGMHVLATVATVLLLWAAGLPVEGARAQAPAAGGPGNSLGLPIDPALLNTLPELKGVVSWNTLAQVKSRTEGKKVVPEFSAEVRQLHQKDVKLQGFMLPIVTGERHDHFLLTMRPPHCPFCLSLGPEYIVEVRAKAPIKHSYDPIVLSGQLNVLSDDPFGLYYRLTGAQLTTAPR